MSSVQATVSFEERREVMRKVEKIIIEAEALNKTRNLRREEVHVSDASSSESEGEFANIPDLSPILNIGSDKSSPQENSRCRGGDVTPRFRNRRKMKPRLAFTDEIELEALSAPRSAPRSVSSMGKLDRSIASTGKSMTSTPSSANTSVISLGSYKGGPVNSVCSTAKHDRSITPAGKSVASTPSSTNNNTASLVSCKGGPTGKCITPASLNLYRGGTANSTGSKVKLDHRTTSTGKSVASRASSTSNSSATPLTHYRGVPVNSPPFSAESPGVETPTSSGRAVATPSSSARKKMSAMKKEINDLTARFESLDKERAKRRSSSSKEINFEEAERAFEEGVDIMGKKTEAVIDALHKSLSHSTVLQRDNVQLKGRVRSLAKSGRVSRSPVVPRDDTGVMCIENQVSLLGPNKTVDHFNPSNEYLKRRYPAIPTTPGTLFVSEIVEVLNLDVGDHTYLSDIMNRQWASSPDYVPS